MICHLPQRKLRRGAGVRHPGNRYRRSKANDPLARGWMTSRRSNASQPIMCDAPQPRQRISNLSDAGVKSKPCCSGIRRSSRWARVHRVRSRAFAGCRNHERSSRKSNHRVPLDGSPRISDAQFVGTLARGVLIIQANARACPAGRQLRYRRMVPLPSGNAVTGTACSLKW